MGNFEQNPWAMSEKQKRAHGEIPMTEKQIRANGKSETAETKEYDFSVAKSIFGGEDDTPSEPKRDEPLKH